MIDLRVAGNPETQLVAQPQVSNLASVMHDPADELYDGVDGWANSHLLEYVIGVRFDFGFSFHNLIHSLQSVGSRMPYSVFSVELLNNVCM